MHHRIPQCITGFHSASQDSTVHHRISQGISIPQGNTLPCLGVDHSISEGIVAQHIIAIAMQLLGICLTLMSKHPLSQSKGHMEGVGRETQAVGLATSCNTKLNRHIHV